MHFNDSNHIHRKTKIALMTTAVIGIALCASGVMSYAHSSPFTQTVFAKGGKASSGGKAKGGSSKSKKKRKVTFSKGPHATKTYSGTHRPGWGNFKVAKSGTANVGKDFNTHGIIWHKAKKTEAYGGEAKRWTKIGSTGGNTNGDNFMYNLNGLHDVTKNYAPGHFWNSTDIKIHNGPSVKYTDVGTMYFNTPGKGLTEKPMKLDAVATLIGYYGAEQGNSSVIFRGDHLSFSHTGGGKAIYDIKLYKSGTNTPASLKHTAIGIWDIDYGQANGVYAEDGSPIYKTVEAAGNGANLFSGEHYGDHGTNASMLWGGPGKSTKRDGTTRDDRTDGGVAWEIDKGNGFIVSFLFNNRNGNDSNPGLIKGLAYKAPIPPSTGGSRIGAKRSPKYKRHVDTPGSFFNIDNSITAMPITSTDTVYVNKYVKKDNGGDSKGWEKKLSGLKYDKKNPSATHYFYRTVVTSAGPSAINDPKSKAKHAMLVLQNLGMTDKDVDSGFDLDKSWTSDMVNGVAFYTQDSNDAKFKKVPASKVSQFLKVEVKKNDTGKQTIHVSLKKPITAKEYLKQPSKYDWLFAKNINMVFKVKGNKDLQHAFTKKIGKNKWQATINNVAIMLYNKGQIQTKKVTVLIESDEKGSEAQLSPTKGIKYVYKMNDGKIGDDKKVNDGDWNWDNYDGGVVRPGQYLTYTMHFKIKAPKATGNSKIKFSKLELKDQIDSNIDHINNLYMGTAERSKQYKLNASGHNIDVTLDEKKYKDLFKKLDRGGGGDIWFRYQAVLKDTKPSSGTLVKNQAQLTASTKKVNKVHITLTHEKKYNTRSTNPDGTTVVTQHTKIERKRLLVWNNDELITELKDLFGDANDGQDKEMKSLISQGWKKQGGSKADWKDFKKLNSKTNWVKNPFEPNITPGQTPKTYSDKKNYDNTTVSQKTEGEFKVEFDLGTLNDSIGDVPKQINFEDKVDDTYFAVTGYSIKDPTGKDVTNMATAKSSPKSADVRWVVQGRENVKKLDFKGGIYTMTIKVKTNMMKQITKTEFKNVATIEEETPGNPLNLKSNEVQMDVEQDPATISKTLQSVTDDRTGEKGDGNTILKPNDPYTLHYYIDVTLGNTDDLSNVNITDILPEHTKIVPDSISIQSAQDQGYSDWKSGGDAGADGGLTPSVFDDGSGFEITGGGDKLHYTEFQIEYDVKVKPEADWSDYYNHDTPSGLGTIRYTTAQNVVNDDSLIEVPNKVTLTTGSNTYEAQASFSMGAQTFKTKQLIIQDAKTASNDWSDNLDPSHYLPHTRNDKTAVTTAIKVVMPNYLKINSVKFYNEAMSAGFDKGQVHTLRADQELVHNEKLLDNPDFTKAGYSEDGHFAGEWKEGLAPNVGGVGYDLAKGDPQNLQDTAGKTFYRFQKWAPKTKYYKDYAKLGDMRTGFKGNVALNAQSVGGSSPSESINKTYDDNNVKIHLSNIYRYMTMLDDAKYYDNGQDLDYRLYGQVKGLAVDREHPTDIDKEGQPIKAWIDSDPTAYKSIGKNAKIVYIKPDHPLKQGDLYDTYARWDKLPAKDYTGHKILHAYNSNSALTEVKGHSVMLTNDLVDDVKGYNADGQHGQGMYSGVQKALPLDNQTLAETRFDNDVDYEKLKNQIMGQANTTYTNPRDYRIYYDFNKDYDGKDISRTYREAYEMFARDKIQAKAGYGLTDTHKLEVFGYYNDHDPAKQKEDDNDHAGLMNHYKTKLVSPQNVFDDGYINNANAEYLDLTHMVVRDDKTIDGALQTSRNNNASVEYLTDGKLGRMPLAVAREKWADEYQGFVDKNDTQHALMPDKAIAGKAFNVQQPVHKLTVMNYRFNKRLLKNGKQAFDTGKYSKDQVANGITDQRAGDFYNAYRRDNTNKVGLNWATMNDATDGGYKNYLKSWITPNQYDLDFTSQSFGVGYMINMKYEQTLEIYGHRYLSQDRYHRQDDKKGTDSSSEDDLVGSSSEDEINVQPAISGKNAQNVGNDKALNDWLKNNDPNQSKVSK